MGGSVYEGEEYATPMNENSEMFKGGKECKPNGVDRIWKRVEGWKGRSVESVCEKCAGGGGASKTHQSVIMGHWSGVFLTGTTQDPPTFHPRHIHDSCWVLGGRRRVWGHDLESRQRF